MSANLTIDTILKLALLKAVGTLNEGNQYEANVALTEVMQTMIDNISMLKCKIA